MKKMIVFITFITMLAGGLRAEQNEPKIVKIYIMDVFKRGSRARPPRLISEQRYKQPVFMLKEEGRSYQDKFYYTPEKLALTNDFELNTDEVERGMHFYIPPYKYKFSLSNNMLNVSILKNLSLVHSYNYRFETTQSNEFVLILGPHTGGQYSSVGYLPVMNMVAYDSEEYQKFEKMLKNYPSLFEQTGVTFYDYLRVLFDPNFPKELGQTFKKKVEEFKNKLRHDRLENFEAVAQSLDR